MSNFRVGQMVGNGRRHARWFTRAIAVLAAATGIACVRPVLSDAGRTLTADVVAFDQPLMYNRLGASNVNGMMFALKRDVVDEAGVPLSIGGRRDGRGRGLAATRQAPAPAGAARVGRRLPDRSTSPTC